MSDRLLLALAVAALSVLAFGLLAGHGPWAGPTLVAFGGHHGLNLGDLPVLAAWAVGVGACAVLARRR